MKKTYVLNTLLTGFVAVCLVAAQLVRTFLPQVILPQLSIPGLVLISVVVLLLEHYLFHGARRGWISVPVLSALTFGLLPWAAGFLTVKGMLVSAVAGGAVFTACTWLYDSILDRISSGPRAKLAPIVSALGLYLASQCFMGIFL